MCDGLVLDSRCECVECVCGEVCAAVEHTYQGERFREDEGLWCAEEVDEGLFERLAQCCLSGGILHDCSVIIVLAYHSNKYLVV